MKLKYIRFRRTTWRQHAALALIALAGLFDNLIILSSFTLLDSEIRCWLLFCTGLSDWAEA